jgi:hypothetical protein
LFTHPCGKKKQPNIILDWRKAGNERQAQKQEEWTKVLLLELANFLVRHNISRRNEKNRILKANNKGISKTCGH